MRKLDGKPAAAQYYRRRRRALYGALKYAVRAKRLSANLRDDKGQLDWKPLEVVVSVNRRRVPNPIQVRALCLTPAPRRTHVAEWAGHSVEVLERVYPHCLDGHDERWFVKAGVL